MVYGYEEALQHFPFVHGGVVPACVIQAIWADSQDPRRNGDAFSPSMAAGCMKEVVLERCKPYALNPLRIWKALEGTFWHSLMWQNKAPGWEAEVSLPGLLYDYDKPGFRKNKGFLEMEWEGMWLSGKLDSLWVEPGGRVYLDDYKTQNCPKTNFKQEYFPPKKTPWPHEEIQVNLYGRMYEVLTGVMPELRIWRYTLGISKAEYSWTPVPVPVMGREELVGRVKPNYLLLKESWAAWAAAMERGGEHAADLVLAGMPLQGRPMFSGKKCNDFCTQRGACDATLALNPAMASDDV